MEEGVYVLRPAPLPAGLLEAGFTGRALRGDARGPLGDRATVRPEQVHGNALRRVDAPGIIPSCDALRTRMPGLLLTVRTADCVPLILCAPGEGIAVVHAGWRGLLARVLEEALATFDHPARVTVLAGPHIGACCYEVGEEVAAGFPSGSLRRAGGSRPRLDLGADARRRLEEGGVPPDRIDVAPICTRCHQHLLPSHRGSGGRAGRIVAFASGARPVHSHAA